MKRYLYAAFTLAILASAAIAQAPKFYLQLSQTPSSASPANSSILTDSNGAVLAVPSYDVRQQGADPTGIIDSTTAINNCLTAAANGTCFLRGKYKILGNISIPANTALDCGAPFPDSQDGANIANYGNLPALLLDSAHTISAAGQGAAVKNCLIYRNGMTFPATNSSAYAGTALSDGGNPSFDIENSEIIGFNSCIKLTGPRPYVKHVYLDCTGVGASLAAFELDTGNTDSGYVEDVKIQPIGTGNGSCTNSVRAGTGFRTGGTQGIIGWIDNIIVQNFQVANYEFVTGALVGKIWSDNIPSCFGSSISFQIDSAAVIYGAALFADRTQTGIKTTSGGAISRIGTVNCTFIGGNCIEVGTAGASGNLVISTVYAATVTGFAVNYLNVNSQFFANNVIMSAVNGGAAPYINSTVAGVISNTKKGGFYINSISSMDLALGTNPYSGFTAAIGSEPALRGINGSIGAVTWPGAGTGTAALKGGSDAIAGVIQLSPTGTQSAGTGVVQYNLPMSTNAAFPVCSVNLVNGGGGATWPVGSTIFIAPNSGTQTTFNWTVTSALTAASIYSISYQCPMF